MGTTSVEPSCYLEDLFSQDAARGKGIGRGRMEAVCTPAPSAGTGRVYRLTRESHETAMNLLNEAADKSGFVVSRKTL
jgi:GNAT superfamily N-acetyltransferase